MNQCDYCSLEGVDVNGSIICKGCALTLIEKGELTGREIEILEKAYGGEITMATKVFLQVT